MAAVWGDPTMGADRFRLNATAVSSYALSSPFFSSLRLNPGRSRGRCERRARSGFFAPTWAPRLINVSSVSDVSRQPGLAASDGCRRSFARGYRISAGNHDATLSVPSWEFPADSDASRVSVWACAR
jgi:hypothetical protein